MVEKLRTSFSFVNLIFGTHNIYKFAELVVTAIESKRMEELLKNKQKKKSSTKSKKYDEVDMGQVSFFDTRKDDDIIKEISELDITRLTPLEALTTLDRLQSELKNRW